MPSSFDSFSAESSEPSAALCATCLRYLLLLRLGALAGQALAYGWVFVVLGLPIPIWSLSLLAALLLTYTVGALWRQREMQGSSHCALWQEAIIDLGTLTFSLFLTGGASNPLVSLLLVPVTVAAATLRPRLIWAVTGGAIASYTLLMFVHMPFPVPHNGRSGFDLHVEGMWYGFILSAVLIATFVAQMGASLRTRDRELAQAREEALVENSPMGVFLIRDGRLTFVNPRLAELLGYQRDELGGVDFLDLVDPADRDIVTRAALVGHTGPNGPKEIECRLIDRHGQPRWVALRNTRINAKGEEMTLGNVLDLTQRKIMETELRHMSARLLMVQEEERARVARDLHDGICQTLTATRLALEGCLGDPPEHERRAPMPKLRALVPMIRGAVDEVRRISTALRPGILDDLGLLATIRWHVGELRKLHANVEIGVHLDAEEEDVPDSLKTAIFRILQEATSNAIRHSAASTLDICLAADDDLVRLAVQDNGVGFAPAAVPLRVAEGGRPGLGLSSMRERTELSGGVFRLLTALGKGTTVEARWHVEEGMVNG